MWHPHTSLTHTRGSCFGFDAQCARATSNPPAGLQSKKMHWATVETPKEVTPHATRSKGGMGEEGSAHTRRESNNAERDKQCNSQVCWHVRTLFHRSRHLNLDASNQHEACPHVQHACSMPACDCHQQLNLNPEACAVHTCKNQPQPLNNNHNNSMHVCTACHSA